MLLERAVAVLEEAIDQQTLESLLIEFGERRVIDERERS